jgi:serine/threonine protein kinase
MGQVWEAWDERLDRPVAVKVISLLSGGGSHAADARVRFLREARLTARLQHPHIVTLHDVGEADVRDARRLSSSWNGYGAKAWTPCCATVT